MDDERTGASASGQKPEVGISASCGLKPTRESQDASKREPAGGPEPIRQPKSEPESAHEPEPVDEVERIARALEAHGRFGLTHGFIQHGDVTVRAHVVSVARASVVAAEFFERLGIRIDRASLIRGALLHDYFLYDWHDPDPTHRLHGFTHPSTALARAEEDFALTDRERNIISRHMFPLVPIPPTCREAWLVCMADKVCALHETIAGRLPKHAMTKRVSTDKEASR